MIFAGSSPIWYPIQSPFSHFEAPFGLGSSGAVPALLPPAPGFAAADRGAGARRGSRNLRVINLFLSLSLYIHTYIHTYIYIYMYIHIYTIKCMCIYIYIDTCVYIYIYDYHTHTHIYIYMYVCMYTYAYSYSWWFLTIAVTVVWCKDGSNQLASCLHGDMIGDTKCH